MFLADSHLTGILVNGDVFVSFYIHYSCLSILLYPASIHHPLWEECKNMDLKKLRNLG
jgi:hypothetical protein